MIGKKHNKRLHDAREKETENGRFSFNVIKCDPRLYQVKVIHLFSTSEIGEEEKREGREREREDGPA